MSNEFDEDYFKGIEEIAAHVDTWPEWKKTGWALLDFEEKPKKTVAQERREFINKLACKHENVVPIYTHLGARISDIYYCNDCKTTQKL